ncbi:MAG: hypothetical protein K9N21_01705 [Deltaproteobacteria bacterium]|nr:hypothetical protein [Deltaproteobacteria bacterium]
MMKRFMSMIRLLVLVGWICLPCQALTASITQTTAAIGQGCEATGPNSTAMG